MFSPDEYDAAHRSAVFTDGGSRGVVALTGQDRKTFLHGLLTQDIAVLTAGTGAYAAYLTPQGRMITDMHVLDTGNETLLIVEHAVAAPLAARLDTLIFSEDVQVKDMTADVEEVRVFGPLSAITIARAAGTSIDSLQALYDNRVVGQLTIARDDTFGLAGFNVYGPSAEAKRFRETLARSGAIRASHGTLEALRIEAGTPLFGVDMDTDTIPLEAGIEKRAISFTKGCYVGQEVIIRVMHRGHGRVARRLVRLLLPGGSIPASGDNVSAGDQKVGHVTSATQSPQAGAPLAMAYVRREFAAPDTALLVNGSAAVVYQGGN